MTPFFFQCNTLIKKFLCLQDRLLVHALVTCDSYCQASLRRLYAAFDLNEDETLNPHDFEALTPQTLNELKHTIDDIVQDLREDSLDEWSESIEVRSTCRCHKISIVCDKSFFSYK